MQLGILPSEAQLLAINPLDFWTSGFLSPLFCAKLKARLNQLRIVTLGSRDLVTSVVIYSRIQQTAIFRRLFNRTQDVSSQQLLDALQTNMKFQRR
jgi:hypothetical protein